MLFFQESPSAAGLKVKVIKPPPEPPARPEEEEEGEEDVSEDVATCLVWSRSLFCSSEPVVCDGVDFDEPMEVGPEEQRGGATEAEPEVAAVVKVEPEAEPQDPVLL